MISAALLLALLAGPAPVAAESPLPAPSLLGTGLLTLQDTRTLPRGRFTIAPALHNRDRDPLGIDVFDYSIAGAVGLTSRLEAYGSAVFSRVVVVPDFSQTWPALPPPPLDLVLPEAMAVPGRPYYAIVPPFPYANGRGDQRFSDLVLGDLVLGAKMRLREAGEGRTGYAVGGDIKIPLTGRMGALQSGSGTGSIDLALRGIAEKRFAGMDIVTSAAVTLVSGPPHADRVLMANPDGSAIVVEELRLPSRIDLAVGLRRALSPHVALVGEMVATIEVYGADTLDQVSPLDLLGGIQARLGRVRLTTGVLYAGGSPPSGAVRPSPLAGFVDLSRSTPEDARLYLEQGGLGGAGVHLRPGVQLVTPRFPGAALPTGARVIPDTYTIVSEHQLGYVFLVGLAF